MVDGMKPCKACGKTVSPNAKTCPHCGGEPKSLWSNPNSLPNKLAPVTLLIVMVLIGSIFGPDKPHPGSAPDNTRAGSLKSYVQELIDVLAYIWPLLVGTVVLVGIVYFALYAKAALPTTMTRTSSSEHPSRHLWVALPAPLALF